MDGPQPMSGFSHSQCRAPAIMAASVSFHLEDNRQVDPLEILSLPQLTLPNEAPQTSGPEEHKAQSPSNDITWKM